MQFGPQSPSNGQVPAFDVRGSKVRWWCARRAMAQASEKRKTARMAAEQLR
jgi:hypothetical protein